MDSDERGLLSVHVTIVDRSMFCAVSGVDVRPNPKVSVFGWKFGICWYGGVLFNFVVGHRPKIGVLGIKDCSQPRRLCGISINGSSYSPCSTYLCDSGGI